MSRLSFVFPGQGSPSVGMLANSNAAYPVLHNTSVEATDDPGQIRALLTMQLYKPMRWVETVHAMVERGVSKLVEAGPGKVLAGLNKRIEKTVQAPPVFDPDTLEKALKGTSDAT